MVTNELIEKLAALEHKQWAHWTRYMLDNLTEENIARWRRQIDTDYQDLPEQEKASDREWARKTVEVVEVLLAAFTDSVEPHDNVRYAT